MQRNLHKNILSLKALFSWDNVGLFFDKSIWDKAHIMARY